MYSTGIIRQVDELGRVSIPREIRHNLGIEVGTPFLKLLLMKITVLF